MQHDRPHARGGEAKTPADRERDGMVRHPVGTVVGGVAGAAAAGAAVGSVAGPVGAVLGAALGAAAGGLTGQLVAGALDPRREDAYWRERWSERGDPEGRTTYEQDWSPAYMYGLTAHAQSPDRTFDDMENDLAGGWEGARGQSRLDWPDARPASLEAWTRARDMAQGPGGDER